LYALLNLTSHFFSGETQWLLPEDQAELDADNAKIEKVASQPASQPTSTYLHCFVGILQVYFVRITWYMYVL
jgi:hypothetical protein